MLGNYALYKKLEKHIDNKISDLKRESIYTIGKTILPLLIVYIYKTFGKTTLTYIFLVFLLFLLFFCFKTARLWVSKPIRNLIEILRFKIGISFQVKSYEKKISSFNKDFQYIIKELAIIKSILPTINSESVDLYVILIKNELENYKNVLFDIGRVLVNDQKYKLESKNLAKKNLSSTIKYYSNFVNQLFEYSKKNNFSDKNSDQTNIFLEDIKSYSYRLEEINNKLNKG